MAKKKDQLTADELAAANAQGMTPDEFIAAYPNKTDRLEAAGATPEQANVRNNEPLQGPGIPGQPSGGGYVTAPKPKDPKSTTPPVNPFEQAETQLFNSLVGQYQNAMSIVNPYISGANAAGYANEAQSIANSFAGGGVQAQNPQTAGIIAKDAAAYGAANFAGTLGVQNAIKGQGPANAAALQAAPYQSILAALQSEAQYKTEQGAGTPALAGSTATPNAVTDPYGAAVALANQSAGTGTNVFGATSVQGANAQVPAANVASPTTNTGGSTGQAGGS